jgi:hypothetical protein
MLHRISLRVLPELALAVTEEGFRKRKRILMLFPGLLGFALYRGLHMAGWHGHIVALLFATGVFSTLVALVAYSYGRERRLIELVREDGGARLVWFGLRFGFFYALQLSLMVLALLKLFSYGYTEHPDGPAMMAVIIAATSVSRDAFELGHLRLLQQQGRSFLICPDTKGFSAVLGGHPSLWRISVALAATAAGGAYLGLALAFPWVQTDLGQLLVIGLLAGAAGTVAYLQGLHPNLTLGQSFSQYSWGELSRFFLWPGVAFGWTYDLILLGVTSYLIPIPIRLLTWHIVVAASTAALLSLYCYYLGRYRLHEEKLKVTLALSMLRCPFILGIVSSRKV